MFKNNIRKLSLAIIAGVMMISSLPFSALAEENSQEANIKLSLVDETKDIHVGDEFEVKVENDNIDDKTLIELPEGITYGDNSHDENISYNGTLVSVLSGSERILKLKAQIEGKLELDYSNDLSSDSGKYEITIFNESEFVEEKMKLRKM